MDDSICIVSGLPRSGTSMMMNALEAGGLPVLVDGIRSADEDNPRGYYELEQVKKIAQDSAWLTQARGKAVKMISYLLAGLPRGHRYKVIFMRRALEEVLRSQKKMLERRGEPTDRPDTEMRRLFVSHLSDVEDWLRSRDDVDVLYVAYAKMIAEPRIQVARVSRFLGDGLNVDRAARVVDAGLYRQRLPEP
jgi:hypothetical protein